MADANRRGPTARRGPTWHLLLDAAAQVVADRGFAGASLAAIADRAGLTTGAVYSNFRSKEALLLELVRAQLDRTVEDPPASIAELVAKARQAATITANPEVQDLFRAQMEIYLLALREPTIRDELRLREGQHVEAVAAVLERATGEEILVASPSLAQLGEVLFATLQGLQQHRLMFPESLPVAVFEWWTAVILRSAAEITSNDRRPGPGTGRRRPG